jgi:crossover junction endodeoxyribonuclease RusA
VGDVVPLSDAIAGWLQAQAGGRTWSLALPAGVPLLTANQRHHWAVRNRVTGELRGHAWAAAQRAGVPRLDVVVVVGEYQPPDRRKRDGENWAPSVKACIDGLRDLRAYGRVVQQRVLADDDAGHVLAAPCVIGPVVYPGGRLILHVTEAVAAGSVGAGRDD